MKKVIIPATLVVLLLIVYMLIPREHNLIVKWETVKKELPVSTPQIKVYIGATVHSSKMPFTAT